MISTINFPLLSVVIFVFLIVFFDQKNKIDILVLPGSEEIIEEVIEEVHVDFGKYTASFKTDEFSVNYTMLNKNKKTSSMVNTVSINSSMYTNPDYMMDLEYHSHETKRFALGAGRSDAFRLMINYKNCQEIKIIELGSIALKMCGVNITINEA